MLSFLYFFLLVVFWIREILALDVDPRIRFRKNYGSDLYWSGHNLRACFKIMLELPVTSI
jgi:hypothetical protein